MALSALERNLPAGSTVIYETGSSSIARARNALAASFVALRRSHPFDYLLWVDSDMVPQPDSARRLLQVAMRTGAEMVSACCFTRVLPKFRTAFAPLDPASTPDEQGLQEAEYVGFGCVLMHRSVLERISSPWFDYEAAEDISLCRKVRASGMRILVDWSHQVGHLSVLPVNYELARANHAGAYPGPSYPG
jgi:GT2 family glycosyltransferase